MNQPEQSKKDSDQPLQMLWPEQRLRTPPIPQVPSGYLLRTYQPGDEPGFYRLMALVGWSDWDDEKLRSRIARIPPRGWFMAVYEATGEIVATAMGLRDRPERLPFDGLLGWVAADPAHAGRGLGMAVSAAATAGLIAAGYNNIHLYTEHWRLAALKIYLRLGYVPFLYLPEMAERWRVVCGQLAWPYTPEAWPTI